MTIAVASRYRVHWIAVRDRHRHDSRRDDGVAENSLSFKQAVRPGQVQGLVAGQKAPPPQVMLALQAAVGNAAVTRALGKDGASQPSVQRRLIAAGTAADFDSFRAHAEPASGVLLGRDPATNQVTAIGS